MLVEVTYLISHSSVKPITFSLAMLTCYTPLALNKPYYLYNHNFRPLSGFYTAIVPGFGALRTSTQSFG